jgi:hypothetical protein
MTSNANQDTEHLRLLSIFYYVWGGLSVLMSFIGVLAVIGMGFGMRQAMRQGGGGGPQPPAWFFAGFFTIMVAALVFALVLAVMSLVAGKQLSSRRGYHFCLVVAGLTCLSFPFGTALGVFTFMVLMRPSVRPLFA